MENKIVNKDTFWYTVGLTLNAFNSLFFLIFVNRINGVDLAGIFSYGFSIACLLYVVGIYQGRVFQVSDISSNLTNKEYLAHKFFTCGLMILLTFIYVGIRDYSLEKNVILILLCLYKCIEAFDETLYAYLQKNDELYIAGKSMFIRSFVGIIVFLLVDLVSHNLILTCVCLLLNSLFFLFIYDFKKSYRYIEKVKVNWKRVFHLFGLGFSVFGFSFLAIYIVNIPKYVIDILLTDEAQTVFSIIVMPGTVVSLCGQYITAPVLNQLVSLFKNNLYRDFHKVVLKIILLLIGMGCLIEICAYFLGIPVLSLVYAIELNDYKKDLILVLVGALCYATAGVLSNALITMRKNNIQLAIYIIDAFIGVFCCYFFISRFGIHGATYGYLATMIIHICLYVLYYGKEIRHLILNCDC